MTSYGPTGCTDCPEGQNACAGRCNPGLQFDTATARCVPYDAVGVAPGCSAQVTFSDHGAGARPGPVTIVPLLWGFDDGSEAYWSWVYASLEASNYYAWIRKEYGAPVLGHVPASATLRPAHATGNVQDADLLADLDDGIRAGALPDGDDKLYVIHLAPQTTVSTSSGTLCQTFDAYNAQRVTFDLLRGGVKTRHYAVIPSAVACGLGKDGVTRVLSHEVIENVTDPSTVLPAAGGWEDDTQPEACGRQIGDLCNGITTTIATATREPDTGQSTLVFQKMWSNAMHACVTEDVAGQPFR
jgi:hypothetical protein